MRTHLRPIPASEPEWITHIAWTEGGRGTDGLVHLGLGSRRVRYAGLDSPGDRRDDLLCAAVAASLDGAIRDVAERERRTLEHLEVLVTGDVDACGARGETGVPVGFQSLHVEIAIRLVGADNGEALRTVLAADRQCVALQTLRVCVPVEIVVSDEL